LARALPLIEEVAPMSGKGLRVAHAAGWIGTFPARWGPAVCCSGGERIGTIIDIVIDEGLNAPAFFIISFGSAPRIGEDCRVIPCALVRQGEAGAMLGCEDERVRDAPIYLQDSDAMNDAWWTRVMRHYDIPLPPS
jgi:hypothetical protein